MANHWDPTEELDDPHGLIADFFQLIDDGFDTELQQLLDYIKFYKDTAAAGDLDKLTLCDNTELCSHFHKEGSSEDTIDWASVPGPKELGKTLMPDIKGQKMTGLMVAAKRGRAEVARIILEECAPDLRKEGTVIIEHHTIEGASALWCAAGAGHLRLVEILVDAGADVNQT